MKKDPQAVFWIIAVLAAALFIIGVTVDFGAKPPSAPAGLAIEGVK